MRRDSDPPTTWCDVGHCGLMGKSDRRAAGADGGQRSGSGSHGGGRRPRSRLGSTDVATLILLRHARSVANSQGLLAGRAPGIGLDPDGAAQAAALPGRLSDVPLAAVHTSPLQRCLETLRPLEQARGLEPAVHEGLLEVDYGDWTLAELGALSTEPLWRVVQHHPSAAVFPGGEGLADVHARAVATVRQLDRQITAEHGPDAVWLACTHGDVIKSVLADALGIHLDSFQRIVVEPCSVSVVRYTELRPFVLRVNDQGDALGGLAPKPEARPGTSSDAVVGGATGG